VLQVSSPHERLVAQLTGIKELSGLSLRALARESGLSSSSLSRYLTGRLLPPWEAVAALCKVVRRDPRPLRPLWTEATRLGPTPTPRRNDLPADLPDFTGRDQELSKIQGLLRTAGAAAVDGMAGVGKTSLALHVAHRLAPAYPDGGLYLDLQGFTPGEKPLDPPLALARLLAGLEVTQLPPATAERAALWRSELSRRRALVVLDNAVDADQVRPLLPGAGRSAVLITSRNRLISLDGVSPVSLAPLPDDEASLLFSRASGRARPGAAHPPGSAAAEVLRECGGLPLALRMAGARLRHRPGWTVAVLAERLRDSPPRFHAVFGMSLHQLDAPQRRLFRLLGVLPGTDFDADAAAAVADLPPAQANEILEELVDAHLVQELTPTRYRMHDLIRRYATDLAAEEEPDLDEVIHRAVTHYAVRARSWAPRPHLPLPDQDAATAWFDLEYVNLVAAFDAAARIGADEVVAELPQALRVWFFRHRGTDEQTRMFEAAAAACARLGRVREQASLLSDLGFAQAAAGRPDEALDAYRRAGRAAPGDDSLSAGLALRTGFAERDRGNFEAARAHFRQARTLFEKLGQPGGQSQALAFDGWVTLRLGDRAEAVELARASLTLAEGPARISGLVTLGLALALASAEPGRIGVEGDSGASGLTSAGSGAHPAEPGAALREALGLAEQHDLRHNQAWCHNALGVALRASGSFQEALEHHDKALELLKPLNEVQLEIDCRREREETLRAAGQ
jgi:tetratricopeptide (TPR) repeat protein/transcriptional regulator with XRE-family HTH domain